MKSMLTYLLIITTISSSVCAQYFSKKASQTIGSIHTAFGLNLFACIFFYVISTACYMFLLRRIPISTAYPMFAISFVLVAMVGHFAFGEHISQFKVIGIMLILLGIICIAMGDIKLTHG